MGDARMRSRAVAAALTLALGGCSNLGYYVQSIGGQIDIWRRERSMETMLADAATPEALRVRLAGILVMREFASRALALPENRSYREYADLGRPYVVWNVFATEEFSTEPVKWCFLVVGCVSYRGYFSREEADRVAGKYARSGLDSYVGPVPAYSTLGWFPDPVLNTFVHYPDFEVARLIFHELAHQVVYVRDDTVFNESFAVAVEREGVRRWLEHHGDRQRREAYERLQRIRAEFADLVRRYREGLSALYRTAIQPEAMRAGKRDLLAAFEREYRTLQSRSWGGYTGYDPWIRVGPNNAQLASVAIYTGLVPGFEALLAREGGDLPQFYAAVKALATLSKEERESRLAALVPGVPLAHTGDMTGSR